MRHDPAAGAIVIMLRSLKMYGMAQAITDLIEQGAPAFEAAIPMLVASGGTTGGLVRPQSYYGAKVVAVWVDKSSLGPNERSWVVVVETAK